MGKFLGWVNVVLLCYMILYYPFKQFCVKNIRKGPKQTFYRNILNTLRKIHPNIGWIILVIAILHGYLLYGSIPYLFYSGNLIVYTLLLIGFTAVIGRKLKIFRTNWRIAHKILGVLSLFFLIRHIF